VKFQRFVKVVDKPAVQDDFHINIAGRVFHIPYETWYLSVQKRKIFHEYANILRGMYHVRFNGDTPNLNGYLEPRSDDLSDVEVSDMQLELV
jgi:hypothetical protein